MWGLFLLPGGGDLLGGIAGFRNPYQELPYKRGAIRHPWRWSGMDLGGAD